MATIRNSKSLGELFVQEGILTQEQLQRAVGEASASGQSLKQVVVRWGLMSEEGVAQLIAAQVDTPTISLSDYLIKPNVLQLVPEAFARQHVLIPVFKNGEVLTVAIEDPLNVYALDQLHISTLCTIKTVVATATAIHQAIDQYYGSSGTAAAVNEAIQDADRSKKETGAMVEAPVVRLVNLLIAQGLKEGASDIHIEPGEHALRTRFRIDGILREVKGPPKHLHSPVVSRIKIMAELDIAERRKPQDGKIQLKIDNSVVDIRVSVMPTQFGEKVVMRLLNRESTLLSFEQLGLPAATRALLEKLIRSPYGIVLVTGPTGSGKTTTLYTALSALNSPERNIVTIEDPIEYCLAGINQVQVNVRAEVTFTTALRSFLRQDPNVIMVGEIRDRDTAEIAIQAALTGHLVFSTLHTNDATSSLTRLVDMEVEPFLVASSLMGVLAQRLVRIICLKCKESYRLEEPVAKELGLTPGTPFFRGRGCDACSRTGYKGRIGIFELMHMTEGMKTLVVSKAASNAIREEARRSGMHTLREDGMAKALAGLTSLEEVLRVTLLEHSSASDPAQPM